MVQGLLRWVVILFPVSEIALAVLKRSRGRGAASADRGSMVLIWLGIGLGLGLAFAARRTTFAGLPGTPRADSVVALIILGAGLAVRWTAILQLGRLFTVDVAIHGGHEVVERGLYRYVRHPSYTGLLGAFLGVGLTFHNWLSLAGLMAPIVLAVARRVATEEKALRSALGPAYAAYCARTRRFIPGVF